MLALLLENVGADKAVRLGKAGVWRAAVGALSDEHNGEPEAPATSFGSSVASFQTVRCIHGFSRSFAREPAKSSRLLTTIGGRW